MSYQDGYLEEDLGTALQWSEHEGPAMINQAISSFTPLNYNRSPVEFINPVNAIRNRSIDGEALYDIPEDDPIDPSPSRGKKRSSPQSANAPLVPLGKVWEYNDAEHKALPHVGGPSVDQTIKRRKPNNTRQRAKSVGIVTKNSIQDDELDKQEEFQLRSPPDTGKRSREKPVSPKSKSRKTRMGPFKSPVITKTPVKTLEKKQAEHVSSLRPISSYQGFTTTEEAVKLSKTTLDKIAAFRHRSSAGKNREEVVPPKISQPGRSEVFPCFKLNELTKPDHQYHLDDEGSLLDDGYLQSRHGVTGAQIKSGNTRTDRANQLGFQTHTESLQEASQGSPHGLDRPKDTSKIANSSRLRRGHHQDESRPEIDFGARYLQEDASKILPDQEPSVIQVQSRISSQYPYSSHHASEDDNPTTSELMTMISLIDIAQRNKQLDRDPDQNLPARTHSFPPNLRKSISENLHVYQDQRFEVITKPLNDSQIELEALNVISLPTKQALDTQWFQHKDPTYLDVQVERSDIGDNPEESRNMSVHYKYDEFDEGLDDSDFLAITSNSFAPQIPSDHKANDVQGQFRGPFGGLAAASEPEYLTEPANSVQQRKTYLSDLGPKHQIIIAETDDEYPIDEDFEKELCNISELSGYIVEQTMSPANLQFDFLDSVSETAYDEALPYSPPMSIKSSVSPTKQSSDRPAAALSGLNLTENNQNPSLAEPENEADWNFSHLRRTAQPVPEMSPRTKLGRQKVSDMNTVIQRPLHSNLSSRNLFPKKHPQGSNGQSRTQFVLDDSHEYERLDPFARPAFPDQTLDRSPIIGLLPGPFLRVCFRIGEMIKEGARCNSLKRSAVIELFARFADMWTHRQPFPNGVLANYKSTGLAESESRAFIGCEEGMMARCLGHLKRDGKVRGAWVLDIINIRQTDWEEIRWTKRIVSAGMKMQTRLPL